MRWGEAPSVADRIDTGSCERQHISCTINIRDRKQKQNSKKGQNRRAAGNEFRQLTIYSFLSNIRTTVTLLFRKMK